MISAIGSDVATWHPPPPSYEMHGETYGPGWSRVGSQLACATLLRKRLTSASEQSRSSWSRDGKTRRVGLSGEVASLVVAVPRVTRRVTGRRVRALGMNCPRVRGGAGLAPAAGLIRSLSAFSA